MRMVRAWMRRVGVVGMGAGAMAIAVGAMASTAAAQGGGGVVKLGAMGDSLTDEYLEETYGTYAKNWTMQIVEGRGVDMGPRASAAVPMPAGGTWGEPRRTGYQYNWARYGADSATMLTDGGGQHNGLAGQVASNGVTHAVMAIGANDFNPATTAYFNIYFGFWSQTQINAYVASKVANLNTAVATVDGAGIELVIANYVDFGIAPATRGIYSNASRRDNVTAAIAKVNAEIELIARRKRLVLLDLSAMATAIFGTNTNLKQFLTVGNVNIQLFNRDTAQHTVPLAGFVDDGAHPHTAVQGVFANAVMTALNVGYGGGTSGTYTLFTDAEILSHAGIAYGGSETLGAQFGNYARFVRDFQCIGNFNGQDGVSVQDIFDFMAAWFAGSASADVNGVGGVTVQDIFDFLGAWFAGC